MKWKIYWAIYGFGMINFVAFIIMSYSVGNTEWGYVGGGHYFLGQQAKWGRKIYTEVSADVFKFALWYSIAVFILAPISAIFGALLLREKRRVKSEALKRLLENSN